MFFYLCDVIINDKLKNGVFMSSVSSATSGSSSALPQTNKKVCAVCEKTAEKMSVCSKCRFTSYCGPECQKKDWSQHKVNCNNLSLNKMSAKFSKISDYFSKVEQARGEEIEKKSQIVAKISADPTKDVRAIVSSQREQLTQMIRSKNEAERLVAMMKSNPEVDFQKSISVMEETILELTDKINSCRAAYETNKATLERVKQLTKR